MQKRVSLIVCKDMKQYDEWIKQEKESNVVNMPIISRTDKISPCIINRVIFLPGADRELANLLGTLIIPEDIMRLHEARLDFINANVMVTIKVNLKKYEQLLKDLSIKD